MYASIGNKAYLRRYSKNKFDLESNLSEILPVNCKFSLVLPNFIW